MKENKYDDNQFFEQYSKMDRSKMGLKGAGEWHVLRGLLPKMEGKLVLDLGCGYGWHCKYAVENWAIEVVGVDLSEKMIAKAKEINDDPKISYKVAAIEDFDYNAQRFDVVISSLTLHYISSFDRVCKDVNSCLKQGGEFVFSVEHPIFTAQGSQQWHKNENGEIQHWPVDNYFDETIRSANFLGEIVSKYHRTLTTYVNDLVTNGFEIINIVEPKPQDELLDKVEGMRDELRRPMMLIIAARKR